MFLSRREIEKKKPIRAREIAALLCPLLSFDWTGTSELEQKVMEGCFFSDFAKSARC